MSDIRKDPLTDTWVIIAPGRAARPHTKEKQKEEEVKKCPFCEGEDVESQIMPYAICAAEFDEDGNWITRVVTNKYPALSPAAELKKEDLDDTFHIEAGVGGHEILVESPAHKYFSWADMPPKQIEAVLRTYKCRYEYWRKDPRIAYLAIFRNYGKVAGASIRHPHSQMIATPLVPPRIQNQMNEMKKYYQKNDECLMCHLIDLERRKEVRLVAENKDFVALSSFAPRFPYETWIVPKKHNSSFDNITDKQIENLAPFLSDLIKRFDKLLNDPPFNLILQVSPLKEKNLPFYHWHIEIIMRLSQPAGFEWGTGVYINSIAPEIAAQELKNEKLRDKNDK